MLSLLMVTQIHAMMANPDPDSTGKDEPHGRPPKELCLAAGKAGILAALLGPPIPQEYMPEVLPLCLKLCQLNSFLAMFCRWDCLPTSTIFTNSLVSIVT